MSMGTDVMITAGLTCAGLAALGAGLGFLLVRLFDRIPAGWLCDYGEAPGDILLSFPRLSRKRYGLLFAVLLGVSYPLLFLQYGFSPPGAFFFFGAALPVLLLLAAADAKYTILPDQLTGILALLGVFYGIACGVHMAATGSFTVLGCLSPLFGALAAGGAPAVLLVIGTLVFKREIMGFGDVKLLAAIGLFCGLWGSVLVLLLTVLFSGLTFALLMAAGRLKRGDMRPLGPFVVAAAFAYLLFSPQLHALADLYLSLFS